ncbi:uncharacterized protein H6S33_013118 [Morchella sextelata]|uniref:uncharacterized protein n=1 Tax=Morchella sextelata TaxID=1174677 RepID=UPI001D0543C7|nr:uncharacterized protein H6S33_013118 [Morchella sextelata]KAH0609632.1 hypothetical protein H6S33_013118 [Morchella sextelata]
MRLTSLAAVLLLSVAPFCTANEPLIPEKRALSGWSAERLLLFLDIRGIAIPFDRSALLDTVKTHAHLAPEVTGFDPEELNSWSCQRLYEYMGTLERKDGEELPECASEEAEQETTSKSKKALADMAVKAINERVGKVQIVGDIKPLKDWTTEELRSFLRTYRLDYPLPPADDLVSLAYENRHLPILPLAFKDPTDIFPYLTTEQLIKWIIKQGQPIALTDRNHPSSGPLNAIQRQEFLRKKARGNYNWHFSKDYKFEDKFREEMAEILGMVHVIEGMGDGALVFYKTEDFELLFEQFGYKIPKRIFEEGPRLKFIGMAKSITHLFATGDLVPNTEILVEDVPRDVPKDAPKDEL